jgi:hypothetical protein
MNKKLYVYFILFWLVAWIPFRFFTPLSFQIRHTYELPSNACTGQLTSDYWTWEFVREGLFVLYLLFPFSICFMLWTREKLAWVTHLFITIVLLAWGVSMLSYDIVSLVGANLPPNDPNFRAENLARDRRWCLYYAGQPGTELLCANTGTCLGPAVDPNSFQINGPFMFRFIMNCIFMACFVFSFWLAAQWYKDLNVASGKREEKGETTINGYLKYNINKK